MEFRVLGPVRVLGDGRPIGPAGPRQERILAALLLGAGRVVPVARLVDVVWDGEPPATAVRQVRNLTTALRRTLVAAGAGEDVLTAEGPGFTLRPDAFDLDVFEDQVARGELREALACWRGPALAGVDSAALRPDAERLEERRLAVLERCLAAEVDAGSGDAVAELTALVAEHPLREGLVGLLMRALHRAGRQADAIDAYQRAKRRLADDLGISPGASLRTLYEQLLHEEPAPGRCFLPYDVPDFTGRAAEVAARARGAARWAARGRRRDGRGREDGVRRARRPPRRRGVPGRAAVRRPARAHPGPGPAPGRSRARGPAAAARRAREPAAGRARRAGRALAVPGRRAPRCSSCWTTPRTPGRWCRCCRETGASGSW